MKRIRLVSLSVLGLFALCLAAPRLPAQTYFDVTIDTSGLNGVTGGLAFDLIAGDRVTPNNTALITNFATDGTLTGTANTNTGSASGSLPGLLTLQDSGFSESFRGDQLGSLLSYTLSLTNNYATPGAPDEFSFFLTNPTNTGTLVTTNDPTGANALFIVDLGGGPAPSLTIFSTNTPGVSASISSVPEPSTLILGLASLLVGGLIAGCRLRYLRRLASAPRFTSA